MLVEVLRDGRLRYRRCRHSGRPVAYDASYCTCCAKQDLEWLEASGEGQLLSYVIYRRQYDPRFPPPYVVGLIELSEGPQLLALGEDIDGGDLRLDAKVCLHGDPEGRLVFRAVRHHGSSE